MFSPNLDRQTLARWTTLLAVFGVIAALMIGFGARPAYAVQVFTVTPNVAEGINGDPDSNCSLREAVAVINSFLPNADCPATQDTGLTNSSIVYVPAGTYSLNPANGSLTLGRNMRLRGPNVNIAAANLTSFTTRPIVPATEAIIQYNADASNQAVIRIQSGQVEVEGLTIRTAAGTYLNVPGIEMANLYNDLHIANNIFTNLTHGITVRQGSTGLNPTNIAGNAFLNMNRPGTLSGIGLYFASINGSNVVIQDNLFSNLSNYAVRFPVIGVSDTLALASINGNVFSGVASAIGLTRNDTISVTNNIFSGINGSFGFNAVIDVFNSVGVDVNANQFINSSLPAVRTRGTINDFIEIEYNRFINTDTIGGGDDAIVLDAGSIAGSITINNNWWGSNDGPDVGGNDGFDDPSSYVGTPTWLAYQVLAAPNPIGVNNTDAPKSELYVDFFSTNDGTTILDNLSGIDVLLRGTPITVALPFSPLPIGTIDKITVNLNEDITDIVRFTAGTSAGAQNINFTLDSETVTYVVNVATPAQVICDYNDSVFGDEGLDLTEGATIGDRCTLKLTSDPGVGNFVNVTISSTDAAVLGFYNVQTGLISLSGPPVSTFDIRFGTVTDITTTPRTISWSDGVLINFSALVNGADTQGPDYYTNLITCDVVSLIGTPPGYSVGDCAGLPSIPAMVYDAGVTVTVVNSDPDFNVNQTDVCTFPGYSRNYTVRLSGPPGLRGGTSTETVTVNLLSLAPTRVGVSPATRVFTRSDWDIPQSATATRTSTPPNVNQPSVIINHFTTSDLGAPFVTTSLYYNDGVDTNGDTLVDGVNQPLTVLNPGCPLLGRDGVVDAGILATAPAAVNVGDTVQFAYNYWAAGLAGVTGVDSGVLVTLEVPAGVLFMGVNEESSLYCATPNEGTAGPVTVSCLFPSDFALYNNGISITGIATQSGALSTTATVTPVGATEGDPANNSSSAALQVN
jgi:hypothetical protein